MESHLGAQYVNVGFVCSDMSPTFHPLYQLHQ